MNKRVFLYLDNQLTGPELEAFEKDLLSDPELKKQLEEGMALFSKAESLNIKPDLTNYFSQSRAAFINSRDEYLRHQKDSAVFSQKIAYAGSLISLVLVTLLLWRQPVNHDYLAQEIAGLSAVDKAELMDKNMLSVESRQLESESLPESEEVSQVLSDEIGLSEASAPEVLDDLSVSTDELLTAVTGDDMDNIFKDYNVYSK